MILSSKHGSKKNMKKKEIILFENNFKIRKKTS